MAHTYQTRNLVNFISDGGIDGQVTIKDFGGEQIQIPMEDLLQFVAHKVRSQKMEELENAPDTAILGLHSEG